MSASNPIQGATLTARLQSIREVAEDRQRATLARKLGITLRRLAFVGARIRALDAMGTDLEAISSAHTLLSRELAELPAGVGDMIGRVDVVEKVTFQLERTEAGASKALRDRLRTLANLAGKLQVDIALSDLSRASTAFDQFALGEGPLRPQLEKLSEHAEHLRQLMRQGEHRILERVRESFGRHVGLEHAKQLMGDGLSISELDTTALQRLLRSGLVENLVLKLK